MHETISLDSFEETPSRFLDQRLAPLQVIGAQTLARERYWLLADKPGTGKTLQALVAIDDDELPVVVCPAVAKGVWARETLKWRPGFVPIIISGRGNFKWPRVLDVVYCSQCFRLLYPKIRKYGRKNFESSGIVLDGPSILGLGASDGKVKHWWSSVKSATETGNPFHEKNISIPDLNAPIDFVVFDDPGDGPLSVNNPSKIGSDRNFVGNINRGYFLSPRRGIEAQLFHVISKNIASYSDIPSSGSVSRSVYDQFCRFPDLCVCGNSFSHGGISFSSIREIVIVNYDILPEKTISSPRKVRLIADECHNLRGNSKVKRVFRWRELAREVSRADGGIWGLSGSPYLNLPPELWNVLNALNLAGTAFGSFPNLRRLFCATKTRFGLKWGNPLPEVPDLLKRVMLRRTREDIFPGMKGKFHSITPVRIDRKTRDLCEEAMRVLYEAGISLDDYVELAAQTAERGASFHQVSEALTALATAKIPAMLEVVDIHEQNEEPLLVFSAHRNPIDALENRTGWGIITGDTSSRKRTEVEDAFQAGDLKGVGLMIQAGGVAITLTRSHKGLFVDRTHVPDINSQAEDRMDRKGQEHLVQIDDLIADHRLDERRTEILIEKQGRIDKTYGPVR